MGLNIPCAKYRPFCLGRNVVKKYCDYHYLLIPQVFAVSVTKALFVDFAILIKF